MKREKREKIVKFYEFLSREIKRIPSKETTEVTDQLFAEQNNVKVPIIQLPFRVKALFNFQPPEHIQIIGSFLTDTCLKQDLTVDILVTIPSTCFQERDYLNHKYFRKCALYLVSIAIHLKNVCENDVQLQFSYFNNIQLKPVLLVKTPKRSRFAPTKGNVRYEWFFKKQSLQDTEQTFATPYYNSIILHDLNFKINSDYFVDHLENNEELKEVIIMFKIWLKNRKYHRSFAFILSMFMFHLIDNKKISRQLNCYSLFRNTLFHFSLSSLDTQGISLSQQTPVDLSDFIDSHDVVFLDVTGFFNLCFDMPLDVYLGLKHEAKLTIDDLDKSSPDIYESMLTKEIVFNEKFDATLLIKSRDFENVIHCIDAEDRLLDFGGDSIKASLTPLINMLNYGLSHRLLLIQREMKTEEIHWELTDVPPTLYSSKEPVKLGFLFNPDHIYDNVDKGPSAEQEEAKDFKELWEEKSELRRFHDGTICEAVYWESKTLSEKRLIIRNALFYLLKKKANLQHLQMNSFMIEHALYLKNMKIQDNQRYGTGEEVMQNIISSSDALLKKIRTLDGLPLDISKFQGISPAFRGADPFPPIGGDPSFLSHRDFKLIKENFVFNKDRLIKPPRLISPLEVVIHMEITGKWPNDIGAIKRLKAAFYLELANQFKTKYNIVSKPQQEFIDIYHEGFVFRLILACYKELVLLRSTTTEEGTVRRNESKEADDFETKIDTIPKLTSALHGVHLKYPAYNLACRLAKIWISSHLFTGHINEITVELIVAYVFCHPFPCSTPNSPVAGFLRFLALIATHDWNNEPLIVNLNDELTTKQIEEIKEQFHKDRFNYPPMFVSSPYDKKTSQFTISSPITPVLRRLVAVAKASRKALNTGLDSSDTLNYQVIFSPPPDIYDVIIHLNPTQVSNFFLAQNKKHLQKFEIKTLGQKTTANNMPIVDFNPLENYLSLLQETYNDIALFFYNKYGGTAVYVIWKPTAFEGKCDIKSSNFCKASEIATAGGSPRCDVNFEAVLEDFEVLGNGIVKEVEIKSRLWLEK
ncbi:Nucleolar protein 6-like protein [Dinothrombium tinctorium]|uniref:Nucleolar protein 6 n=1 Tax=Dinothrombium tinctorium TaxID=1965070 RepID=A0A3S3PVV0_9ACAR|nr:Nucleolar protein 6-like protein [Dinothrombium tinctorium]RWS09254.1 Nucleolar protein 6-like protein [Dinothrombium tinctorium]RWS09290.1 Nucleolar protein 6-like protein [Dinothrombium tinctorium]